MTCRASAATTTAPTYFLAYLPALPGGSDVAVWAGPAEDADRAKAQAEARLAQDPDEWEGELAVLPATRALAEDTDGRAWTVRNGTAMLASEADATAHETGAARVGCACGETSGEPCGWRGPLADTVLVEWMPEHLRGRHAHAGHVGAWPGNGALRLRCAPACAERITHLLDDEGCQTTEPDPWAWVVE